MNRSANQCLWRQDNLPKKKNRKKLTFGGSILANCPWANSPVTNAFVVKIETAHLCCHWLTLLLHSSQPLLSQCFYGKKNSSPVLPLVSSSPSSSSSLSSTMTVLMVFIVKVPSGFSTFSSRISTTSFDCTSKKRS